MLSRRAVAALIPPAAGTLIALAYFLEDAAMQERLAAELAARGFTLAYRELEAERAALRDQFVGYAVMAAFYGGLLYCLYHLVRRSIHPTRSALLTYLTSVAVFVAVPVFWLAALQIIASAAGVVSPGKALIGIGVGGIVGSYVFGWQILKGWMSGPRHTAGAAPSAQASKASSPAAQALLAGSLLALRPGEKPDDLLQDVGKSLAESARTARPMLSRLTVGASLALVPLLIALAFFKQSSTEAEFKEWQNAANSYMLLVSVLVSICFVIWASKRLEGKSTRPIRSQGDPIEPKPQLARWAALCLLWTVQFRMSPKSIGFAFLAALGVVGLAVFGIFHANTAKTRSAGELAGVFAWAEHKCSGRPTPGAIEALQSYRWGNFNAYNAGFVEGSAKLERARQAIGLAKACELFVNPYRGEVIGIGAGLWLPRLPEPAWIAFAPVQPRREVEQNSWLSIETWRNNFKRDNREFLEAEERAARRLTPPGDPESEAASQPKPPLKEKPATAVAMTHGVVRRAPGGEAIAPFAVKTSSGGSYFVKLVRPSDNQELIAAFIVGGLPFSTNVPVGTYELRYAVGQQWVSEQDYFGPSTSFFKADRLLEFSVEGGRVRGTEVELILQRGGNLRTNNIPRGSF